LAVIGAPNRRDDGVKPRAVRAGVGIAGTAARRERKSFPKKANIAIFSGRHYVDLQRY
jgi:hypothetical protein